MISAAQSSHQSRFVFGFLLWTRGVCVAIFGLFFFCNVTASTPDALNANIQGFYVSATAIQPDGKIIIGGNFSSVGGQTRNNIARLNTDGTLDTAFNPNVTGTINSLVVQADGKILLGGFFTRVGGQIRPSIARLHSDGTRDAGFNPNVSNDVYSVAAQADGKILIGGHFTLAGWTERNFFARLNGDGTLDAGFTPNGDGIVSSVAVQADGKILLAGNFSLVNGQQRNRIARLNTDLTVDAGFNPNADSELNCMAVQANGKILLGSGSVKVGGQTRRGLTRLNADGTVDMAFNPDSLSVGCVAVQADGKILIGGSISTVNGVPRKNIARLNADGTLDTVFNPIASNSVFSVALQADGKILLGGDFSFVGEIERELFSRLVNDPATQSLTIPGASRVQWLRGGASPEVETVTFELSTDGGITYSTLGVGTRISGGWERTGLSLPTSGRIRARGRAGNYGLMETVTSFTLDSPPILVTSVNSSVSNTTYKVGDVIPVTVNFGAAVLVIGTPQLTLETGSTDRVVNYSSGSNSNSLTFNYTVQEGDVSSDLDYISFTALALNGGTISPTSGTADVLLTLAAPGTAGSLAANKALVIDGIRPTVGIVVADSTITLGETSLVTFTFSESVTGFTNADLIIPNGQLTPVSTSDGGISFTGTFTPAAGIADLTNVIALNLTGVTDSAGNLGTGSTNSNNITINTASTPYAPNTVFLVDHSNTSPSVPTLGGTWNTTSPSGMPLTTPYPLLTSTGNSSGMAITYGGMFGAFGSQTVWSRGNQDWVDAATTRDNYGSTPGATTSITFSGLVSGDAYKIDHLAARAGAGFTRSADYTINGQFANTDPNGDNFDAFTSGYVNGKVLTWNYVTAVDGRITLTVTPINSSSFGFYTATRLTVLGPTLVITSNVATLKVGETATITFTFLADPGGTFTWGGSTGDVVVSGGSLGAITGSGLTRTATFTPTASTNSGTASITVAASSYSDAAGNNGGAGTTPSLTFDTLRPTVAIVVADSAITLGETSLVTFTFSEAVTGFTNADLIIPNGQLTPVSTSDGGITFTGTFTPAADVADFTNVIALNLTGVTDSAGNAGTGSTNSNNFTINTVPPTVTIAATTATAIEGGTTGLYRFNRTGSTSGPLTINFQLDANSTATAGTDFNLTSTSTLTFTNGTGAGTLTIPSGSNSATVTLTALIETLNAAETAENARLNITTSSNYTIGSPANATVTIAANGFVVINVNDSGTGSLRQAMVNADLLAGVDTITFSSSVFGTTPQVIELLSELPTIRTEMIISGPGASYLNLQRPFTAAEFRIMSVSGISGNLHLSGVTITGGKSGVGGGIQNSGTLTVMNATFTDNFAEFGGGAIYNTNGNLMVLNSTFSKNKATDGFGGGIYNILSTLTVTNSTFNKNMASYGGGIFHDGDTGIITITNSTISGNESTAAGGGVVGTVIAANSIFADNGTDINGTLISQGYNFLGTDDFTTITGTLTGNQVGSNGITIDAKLGPLANNGGPTQTMALLSNSPAINAGPATSLLTTDQRGPSFSRVVGTASDIGAFEQDKFVSILADASSSNEGSSGITNFTFTVSRIGGTGPVNVTYTVSGAAVSAADFGGSLPTGIATIADGATSTTVTIPVSGDLIVEPNEDFTVTLTAPTNGYVVFGAGARSSTTIIDDDTATVSIAKINDGAETNTPVAALFRVTQTAQSSTATTLSYSISSTASSGSDFTALTGRVTIPAGAITADIPVTVLNDAIVEATETVTLTLTGFTERDPEITLSSLSSATTAIADVTDNDTATGSIAKITDGAETTSPTNALFRVTQNAVSSTNTTLSYTVAGTAASGTDFTALSGTVTILAGQTTADISVPVLDETLVEATETVIATLNTITSGDADITLGTTVAATANITDNDTAIVTLAEVNDGVEAAVPTNALFRVTQTAASSTNTVVTYAVTGTAASGTDYIALSGSVTVLAGQTTADISVPVLDETLVEATETVIATLNGFTAGDADITLGTTVAATVDITDNDTAIVTLAKVNDGVEATVPTNALFRVTQTAASSTNTTLSYSVAGTATSGTDYTALSGTVTILAGNTTADISVAVLNENIVEATETVSLTLTAITSGDTDITIGGSNTATANITDSDTSVITLAKVNADQNEGTGGSSTAFTFSVTLSNPVQGGFTIAYTSSDGSALAGSDYTDNDSTLAFTGTVSESKTITVAVTHDGTNELDETFTVALGAITGTTLGGSLSTADSPQTGDIRNDDDLVVTIAANDAEADENTAGTGTYHVSRNGVLGNTTVQLAIDGSSSAVAADWSQSGVTFTSLAPGSNGTIVIPAGSTFVDITLTPSADLHAEAAETIRINVTADAAYTLVSPVNATVTIGQNDFHVINTNDAGEGTLRQAILNANAIAGTDTITFDPTAFASARTITLASGELVLSSNLSIHSPVALTVSGNNASRVFSVGTESTVSMSGMIITGGNGVGASFNGSRGGGVLNQGTLTLRNSTVTSNAFSADGAGLHNTGGVLNLDSCTVSNNTSTNSASTAAGVNNTGGSLTIVNCTFSGNQITANSGNGGAVWSSGTTTISQSTFTFNSAVGASAGGVYRAGGTVTVSNSLIAGNVSNSNIPDVRGTFTSGGGNIIGNVGTATGFTGTNDLTGTGAAPLNPLLGALADNGGPTLTHSVLNGSPAINNGLVANMPTDTFDLDGDSNTTEALPVDQRGGLNLRQRGPAPDSGAVEAFAFEPTLTTATTNEDTQSSSGLVITANLADDGFTTHYQITGITAGMLFKNDGTTLIAENDFITKAEGAAGLKFTPNLNLNNSTTALFGFTAQAAVGTTAPVDLLGATESTTISVTPVNDAPTVVSLGILDQTLIVGASVVIPLPAIFVDVEFDTLIFTVSGNSFPAKASASITGGTNVTLTALANGITDITIQADDGNMGLVTDTFQVAVGTVNPTPVQLTTSAVGNRQNGLFDFTVNVTNTTPRPINGFRLRVDFASYIAAYPSLRLYNATSVAGSSDVFVDYPYPVAVDAVVPVTLSFYTINRSFPNPFSPTLSVEILPVSAVSYLNAAGVQPRIERIGSNILLEFPSVPGRWYRVSYSHNLADWFESPVPIQASTNRMQWIDSGAPFTVSPTSSVSMRYYRVNEVMAASPAP